MSEYVSRPRVIQVIESEVLRGCGVSPCRQAHEHEPFRRVVQYHTVDGNFLAESDPLRDPPAVLRGSAS